MKRNLTSTFLNLRIRAKKHLSTRIMLLLWSTIKVESTNLSVNGSIVKIKLDKPNGENLIRVGVTNNGQVSNIQYVHTYDGKPIDNNYWTWYDGVIYSLMVDRFYDGDLSLNNPIKHDSLADKANYMGGDLQGIINKINTGYFDSLSVNVIWISRFTIIQMKHIENIPNRIVTSAVITVIGRFII